MRQYEGDKYFSEGMRDKIYVRITTRKHNFDENEKKRAGEKTPALEMKAVRHFRFLSRVLRYDLRNVHARAP